ncbi:hypothetical protein DSY14_03470 [Nocardiopsis sp. MG754419]|nr:hypothetical protein [Nocardiopsis sp. MG754419]
MAAGVDLAAVRARARFPRGKRGVGGSSGDEDRDRLGRIKVDPVRVRLLAMVRGEEAGYDRVLEELFSLL